MKKLILGTLLLILTTSIYAEENDRFIWKKIRGIGLPDYLVIDKKTGCEYASTDGHLTVLWCPGDAIKKKWTEEQNDKYD